MSLGRHDALSVDYIQRQETGEPVHIDLILHRMWRDAADFRFGKEPTADAASAAA